MNSIIEAQQTFKQFEYNLGVSEIFGILTLNDKICNVQYQDDKGYAVFECDGKGYILRDRVLYLMKDKAYINILLKMNTIDNQYHPEKPSCIKNVLMKWSSIDMI